MVHPKDYAQLAHATQDVAQGAPEALQALYRAPACGVNVPAVRL